MKTLLAITLIFICSSAISQDMIIMSNGDIHEGKIKEITESEVKYQKKELPDGPTYSIGKSGVLMLKYENGYTEVFKNNTTSAKPEENIPEEGVFSDSRDGNEYKFKKIGDQVWFTENLRYKTATSASYDGLVANVEKYGYYYTWDEARDACPDGWHTASDEDWIQLEMHAGMVYRAALGKGWRGTHPGQAPKLIIGGSTGLDLLLAGFLKHNNKSEALRKEGFYWTSSADKSYCAWMRHFSERASIEREEMTLTYKLPVRCVKDK